MTLLSMPDASDRLGGVSRTTLYKLTQLGLVESVKVLGSRRWIAESIDDYIASQRGQSAGVA
jgi:predicted DNA-binding transcriptional regulator AlpA